VAELAAAVTGAELVPDVDAFKSRSEFFPPVGPPRPAQQPGGRAAAAKKRRQK
jgi:hypothetical protein